MKMVKGMPITGTNQQKSRKRPYVPDAKETSLDTQNTIKEPPAPFKNRMTAAQMPTGSQAQNGMEPNISAGKSGSRAPFHPGMAPAGQRTMPNQSGQVNGRMGTSFPKRKKLNGGGFPSKRNAAFYGE